MKKISYLYLAIIIGGIEFCFLFPHSVRHVHTHAPDGREITPWSREGREFSESIDGSLNQGEMASLSRRRFGAREMPDARVKQKRLTPSSYSMGSRPRPGRPSSFQQKPKISVLGVNSKPALSSNPQDTVNKPPEVKVKEITVKPIPKDSGFGDGYIPFSEKPIESSETVTKPRELMPSGPVMIAKPIKSNFDADNWGKYLSTSEIRERIASWLPQGWKLREEGESVRDGDLVFLHTAYGMKNRVVDEVKEYAPCEVFSFIINKKGSNVTFCDAGRALQGKKVLPLSIEKFSYFRAMYRMQNSPVEEVINYDYSMTSGGYIAEFGMQGAVSNNNTKLAVGMLFDLQKQETDFERSLPEDQRKSIGNFFKNPIKLVAAAYGQPSPSLEISSSIFSVDGGGFPPLLPLNSDDKENIDFMRKSLEENPVQLTIEPQL